MGPAGKLLDEAMREAGIDRKDVYITNVVKHFKWEPSERGKRRIHKKPAAAEMGACRPWLDAELERCEPGGFGMSGCLRCTGFIGEDS